MLFVVVGGYVTCVCLNRQQTETRLLMPCFVCHFKRKLGLRQVIANRETRRGERRVSNWRDLFVRQIAGQVVSCRIESCKYRKAIRVRNSKLQFVIHESCGGKLERSFESDGEHIQGKLVVCECLAAFKGGQVLFGLSRVHGGGGEGASFIKSSSTKTALPRPPATMP